MSHLYRVLFVILCILFCIVAEDTITTSDETATTITEATPEATETTTETTTATETTPETATEITTDTDTTDSKMEYHRLPTYVRQKINYKNTMLNHLHSPHHEPLFDTTIEHNDDDVIPVPVSLAEQHVFHRGLVTVNQTTNSILEHCDQPWANLNTKSFAGETLGYLTPWNRHGFDVAMANGKRFDYLSPVWYQIKVEWKRQTKKLKVTLTGGHDASDQVLNLLRRSSMRDTKNGDLIRARIVPRFIMEVEPDIYLKLADNIKLQDAVIAKVNKELEKHKYDGLVLEMTEAWNQVERAKGNRKGLNNFLNRWADNLHASTPKRLLILVVRPYHLESRYFQRADFLETYQHVDRYQLMTYDYNYKPEGGPSAPLFWVYAVIREFVGHENMENTEYTHKVMIGLNFYGMDYSSAGAKAVIGAEYVKILTDHPDAVITWNEEHSEHYTNYTTTDEKTGAVEKHQLYYPSLKSLAIRLEMAAKFKVGVAIWECGQGLNYFVDLL